MASIIPGFNYDIFISYRQKDNRSLWVTDFVNALREELDATFKEDVSIYFDVNPHDGLLETHQVAKSLEGKLKCLILIPIISQTYCDPKSYAWQYEFCAFNKKAASDEYGMFVTLPNGNVVMRILPVKIHELDAQDTEMIEKEVGGHLRAIDFIFKSPGVNRPLSHDEDHPADNQNKTFYKDQINKVANAIKEIVTALKANDDVSGPQRRRQQKPKASKSLSKILAWGSIMVLALVVAGYFIHSKFVDIPADTALDKTIAVLPFADMSPNKDQEYFSDGISEEIINALAKIPELNVTGRTSSFAYKGKNIDLKEIGKELGVSTLLEGSVRKSGNTLRITAQLINTESGFHLWTESYDRELTDVFAIQDEITDAIIKQLRVHLEGKQAQQTKATATNLTAYEIYLKARQQLAVRREHLIEAKALFEKVIELDSNYAPAYAGLARTLSAMPSWVVVQSRPVLEEARKYALRAIEMDSSNAEAYSVMGTVALYGDWKFKQAKEYFDKSYELNPNDTEVLNWLGDFYIATLDPRMMETKRKAFELDPLHPIKSNDLAWACNVMGHHEMALGHAEFAMKMDSFLISPFNNYVGATYNLQRYDDMEKIINNYKGRLGANHPEVVNSEAYLALGRGDMDTLAKKVEEYKALVEKGETDAATLAAIYLEMNRSEDAVKWLEVAYQNREVALLGNGVGRSADWFDNPVFQKVIDKPDWQELLEIRRANLKKWKSSSR